MAYIKNQAVATNVACPSDIITKTKQRCNLSIMSTFFQPLFCRSPKKTPNLTFSAIFFEFAYRSKIQDKFMFLISMNFNKQHKTSYKII
jgi:hypothetical protein